MELINLTEIVSLLAFFTFIAVFIPILRSKELFRKSKVIFIASLSLLISNLSLTIYLKTEMFQNAPWLYAFVSYSTISLAFVLLQTLIISIYDKTHKASYSQISIYALCIGVFYAIATYFDFNYFNSSFVYGISLSIPVLYTSSILKKNNVNPLSNVFHYQFVMLGIIYILKMANLYFTDDESSFVNLSTSDGMLNMFSVMIIITMIISYFIENKVLVISNLKSNESLLEQSLQKVKTLSETDQLTNLSNRHKIEHDLESLLKNYEFSGVKFSILMCDIDNFKSINDTFGHNTGDEVIKFIADELVRILRTEDIVGRWGGDEFIVLLPKTDMDSIKSIVNKINEHFKKHDVNSINGFVSLSIGSGTIRNMYSTKELLDIADKRMYIDKASINNR